MAPPFSPFHLDSRHRTSLKFVSIIRAADKSRRSDPRSRRAANDRMRLAEFGRPRSYIRDVLTSKSQIRHYSAIRYRRPLGESRQRVSPIVVVHLNRSAHPRRPLSLDRARRASLRIPICTRLISLIARAAVRKVPRSMRKSPDRVSISPIEIKPGARVNPRASARSDRPLRRRRNASRPTQRRDATRRRKCRCAAPIFAVWPRRKKNVLTAVA